MLQIGDKVRFLNSIGGGIVRKFQGKDIVLVEEEDGFETPVLARECVIIEAVNDLNFPVGKPQPTVAPVLVEMQQQISSSPAYAYGDETPEGEQLSIYLAFVPQNIKQLQSTATDLYLVNDSNYFLSYTLATAAEDNKEQLRAESKIEPNTKELLATIEKTALNDWEHIRLQCLPFKTKNYAAKAAIDAKMRINPVKFYKLHSFIENDFFDEDALLLSVVERDMPVSKISITPDEAKEMFQPTKAEQPRKRIGDRHSKKSEIIEIDLHINALLDTMTGMSAADMLQYQLDKFNRTLQENKNKKEQKIVFIHGKGEGTLRRELTKQLKSNYPGYYVQDASFREYGFGATMVTIK